MILLNVRSLGWNGRRYAVAVGVLMVSTAALLILVTGCKQSKTGSVLEGTPNEASQPTSPTSTQAVVSPTVVTKFRCQSPKGASSEYDDHYFVDFDAKTVRTDAINHFAPDSSTVSITEDAITFTQSADLGQMVFQQHIGINRKGGAFTVEGKKVGKCVVVQEF